MRGGPWTEEEAHQLLNYCESDVVGLSELFYKTIPDIDLPRALLRGCYMGAAARIEHTGVPIDLIALTEIRTNWRDLQLELIRRIDST